MKVENEINPVSINNEDTKVGNTKLLTIRNVWNRKKFVELQFDDESKIIINQNELLKAIKNATDNED